MNDTTQTTSLNLLLTISAVVLVGIGVTWFVFDHLQKKQAPPPPVASIVSVADRAPANPAPVEAIPSDTTDSHLSKARLAAEANMLFEPAGQNALYFLGLVLSDTPDHPEANEEFDRITALLRPTVRQAMAQNDFERPYKIAQTVSGLRSEHPLVDDVQKALRQRSETLFTAALERADAGDRRDALAALTEARRLPGADDGRILATQTELEARLSAYEAAAAEQRREAQQRLAEANAVPKWLVNAETALADGRLIEPADESAFHYLSQAKAGDSDAGEFQEKLLSAVLSATELATDRGEFSDADRLLEVATEHGGNGERIATLRTALNRAYAEMEAAKIIPTSSLVWVERVAPVYPRVAQRRGMQGQVDVGFTVTTSGETKDIVVLTSEPAEIFDRAAIQAVQQWQFEPHTVRGVLVNQRSATRLRFTLN